MVDSYVLNFSNQLVFFLLIKKYKIIKPVSALKKKLTFSFKDKKTTQIEIILKKKSYLTKGLNKNSPSSISKYHKFYLNILSLKFYISNRLNKKTSLFFYPLRQTRFNNNIFLQKFFFTIKQHFKGYTRFFYFIKAMKLILISIFFNKPVILNQVIANLLKNNKKHSFVLKFIENILQFLLARWSYLLLIGLKLKICGKLNGRHRKQTKKIQLGLNPLQTLSIYTNYSLNTAHTKFGSFGIGVWFFKK